MGILSFHVRNFSPASSSKNTPLVPMSLTGVRNMAIAYRFDIFLPVMLVVLVLNSIAFIPKAEATVYVSASGHTLYVSPSGSDASSDCSISAPCREIRRALTLVQTGDLIAVADGSYLCFNIDGKHGTALAPIIIQASGFGADIMVTT